MVDTALQLAQGMAVHLEDPHRPTTNSEVNPEAQAKFPNPLGQVFAKKSPQRKLLQERLSVLIHTGHHKIFLKSMEITSQLAIILIILPKSHIPPLCHKVPLVPFLELAIPISEAWKTI